MERSNRMTSHILINATTNSHWDTVDFAIIYLTDAFKIALQRRLSTVRRFVEDESFSNIIYWDAPLGYFCNSRNSSFKQKIIKDGESWAFIHLDEQEEQNFAVPQNTLKSHQLLVSKHGFACFKALSKYQNEEYLTDWFSISQVLYLPGSVLTGT